MPSAKHHARVLAAVEGEPWLITGNYLETILSIAQGYGDKASLPSSVRGNYSKPEMLHGGVAVMAVRGPIFRYADLFTDVSGATALARMMSDFAEMRDDPGVRAIVLDIDSPGGEARGINEFSAMVREATKIKPVVAYVGGTAASAAYWIASACSEIVADSLASLGSIGAVMGWTDSSKQQEMLGLKAYEIVSSQSPKKRMDPASQDGRAMYQERVDALAEIFIGAVAENRRTTAENVIENFGQGGIMLAGAAIAVGMADRIGSMETVLSELAARDRPAPRHITAEVQTMPIEMTAEAVNKDWLAANRPEVLKEIQDEARAAGALEERKRIQAIEGAAIPGHEAIVAKAKYEQPMSAEAMALEILQAERKTRATTAQALAADAEGVAVDPGAVDQGGDAKAAAEAAELKTAAEAMAAARRF